MTCQTFNAKSCSLVFYFIHLYPQTISYLTMRKALLTLVFLTVALLPSLAAGSPVRFTVSENKISANEVELVFSATIDQGWHIFGTTIPSGGPTPTTLNIEQLQGAKAVGSLTAQGQEKEEMSMAFGMVLRFYEQAVTFRQKYRLTGGGYRISGYLQYATCNARMCMPPTNVEFDFKGTSKASLPTIAQEEEPKTTTPNQKKDADTPTPSQESENTQNGNSIILQDIATDSTADTTVTDTLFAAQQVSSTPSGEAGRSAWYLFLMGLAGGLLALCTPCVWPIIPMTVSFFLKRSNNRRKGIRDAVGYGLSIIAVFLSLGLAVSLMGRGNWLNDLATNSIFNIILCLLLIVFALSFFGWFEIRLPSRWADKVDTKASSTTGWISIFLMALTLVLVSFSCTAPIVGLLLVEASTSGLQSGALVGMLGFALALALPFTLFALFPSWLKELPKSGSWMNIVKVSLGFIELAFACKFFSVADMAYGWHLMDREVFLVLWIVIFASLGLYLMGLLHFQSDGPERTAKPVPCILLGMCSLAFALYMVPGLWGAPCRAVAAFSPPISTQEFNLNQEQVEAAYTDYDEGMAAARRQGKPVLLDFTGFGCVNCRKMEASVWTDPTVARTLNNDYILISLYVDDKTPLPQRQEVRNADGSMRILRTVGDRWSYFEESRFGYLAQPFYVAIDTDGKVLTDPFAYNESVPAFMEFLKRGLSSYRSVPTVPVQTGSNP